MNQIKNTSSYEPHRNKLKNREFGEEVPQNLHSEGVTIAERQGTSENENSEANPTKPKPDSSDCFGMEHKLLRRLKFMGYVFCTCSLASLGFAFLISADATPPPVPLIIDENSILNDIQKLSGASLFSDMHPLEIAAQDVLNFYLVALLFAGIGFYLFYLSAKRIKALRRSLNLSD